MIMSDEGNCFVIHGDERCESLEHHCVSEGNVEEAVVVCLFDALQVFVIDSSLYDPRSPNREL